MNSRWIFDEGRRKNCMATTFWWIGLSILTNYYYYIFLPLYHLDKTKQPKIECITLSNNQQH